MTEYRDKSSVCSCCGGDIPAGKIRWSKTGECPGSVNADDGTCGAIEEILPPSKLGLDEQIDESREGDRKAIEELRRQKQ